jgi:AraC-like DNA-binding protein
MLRLGRGIGFVELLQQYRLERAAQQLRDSENSLTTIAGACGFGSASYLIRLFRRQYGSTPEAWRLAWHRASGPAS